MVARQQQEPEADLRDDEGLGKREHVREQAARLGVAVVRPPADRRRGERSGDDRERHRMVNADHGGGAYPRGCGYSLSV